jgi:hypothetical protein
MEGVLAQGEIAQNSPRLFMAVSTAQGVANLAPILELVNSQRGDVVLWLESPEAKRAGWTAGPQSVLKSRNVSRIDSINVPVEPHGIAQAVAAALDHYPSFQPTLVANGGTKMMTLAIASSLADKPYRIIYGQDQPVEFWQLENRVVGPLVRKPYKRGRLGLREILASSGHTLREPSDAVRFWPDDYTFASDAYGVDTPFTARFHDLAEKDVLDRTLERLTDLREIRYEQARLVAPQTLISWCEGVANKLAAFQLAPEDQDRISELRRMRSLGQAGTQWSDYWIDFAERHQANLAPIFNGAQNVAKRIDRDKSKKDENNSRVGSQFERAVARRVQAWLKKNGSLLPVTEAWLGAKIPQRHSSDLLAELDVALVLHNGILLHLECKTYRTSSKKDLDARLLNLQRSTSGLARLAVCAPVYTEFHDREWFQHIQTEIRERVEGFLPFIGFTLPNQPLEFAFDNGSGDTSPHQCVPFEDSLNNLIAPYCRQRSEG